MAEPNFEAGLRSLRQSLRQIEALSAWQQLKQAETRPDQPPGFRMADPVETDLRNECSFFLATAMQIRSILNDGSYAIAEQRRQSFKIQLAKIEQQLCRLNLNGRLCIC
jgi:hypothetical protein